MTRDEAIKVVRVARTNWMWVWDEGAEGPIKWNVKDLKELIDAALFLTEGE